MEPVKERLHDRLNHTELYQVREALLLYMVENDYDAKYVFADSFLVTELLPYLVKQHSQWKGVEKVKDWKKCSIYSHLLE